MKRATLLSFVSVFLIAARVAIATAAEHDFARWESEIAAMEAADRASPPPKGALLFAGSSTIRLWKTLATDFPDQRVINRGFGGSEIVDSTHFAERLIFPCAPRAVFLRAGGNDLKNGKTPAVVFADFKAFAATVHTKLPATEIFFIGWSPAIARWDQRDREKELNALVEAFARTTPRVHYIEAHDITLDANGQPRPELFAEDKLHFSDAGYRLLVERVRPHLPK